jgi:hypothetical protein
MCLRNGHELPRNRSQHMRPVSLNPKLPHVIQGASAAVDLVALDASGTPSRMARHPACSK